MTILSVVNPGSVKLDLLDAQINKHTGICIQLHA